MMETERKREAQDKGIRRMETNRFRSFIIVCLVIAGFGLTDAVRACDPECYTAEDCKGACQTCQGGNCVDPDLDDCEDCQVYDWEDCDCRATACPPPVSYTHLRAHET